MSRVRFIDGPCKRGELDLHAEMKIGTSISVPVEDLTKYFGQRYVHYIISGFIDEVFLAREARLDIAPSSNG